MLYGLVYSKHTDEFCKLHITNTTDHPYLLYKSSRHIVQVVLTEWNDLQHNKK